MKYLLLALLSVHGLIHLMGFAKAFDYAALEQLKEPISRPAGAAWLAAALLFLAAGVLLLVAPRWWWVVAALALVLSQVVISASWGDAKAGTVANLVLLVPVLVAALAVAPWSFRAEYRRDVAAGLAGAPAEIPPVTEADLAPLPAALQRYLRFSGVVGKPRVWNYRARFRGEIRNGLDAPWMRFTADQQSFVEPAARLWLLEASRAGVPFTAYHRYVGPAATFRVRVASLLGVVDAKGPEMDRGETVTLFNDLCILAPATLIDPSIRWEEIDSLEVRGTFTNAAQTVSAVLTFDATGALRDFVSEDRTQTVDGKTYAHYPWSTPVSAWRDFGGYRLAAAGEAVWAMPSGPFPYARMEIVSVEYNVGAR